ncbi:hypothetical protein F3Y22_tig00110637pilonHSYRG00103 [Hibiscus syriacus]|uniref:Peptidase A1 domain-containing protein n=1 Tax=Hibiscus syriacus TaxID=106335 RepID=A0A6A2ZXY7_HIBSY|nr:hypothetical protein F3Y22_tig00110637pilonHSYRG00103 [Hibiscus syriacus]
MERSSMWRACASKRAFRIGVLCAILTPVAKVMAKRLKHTQNDPNKEHVTINSRLCADLPTHGISAPSTCNLTAQHHLSQIPLHQSPRVGKRLGAKKLPIPVQVFRPDAAGSGQTMIDSGSEFTYLVDEAYNKVREEVVRLIGPRLKKGYVYGGVADMCFDGNPIEIGRSIGDMTFEFEKGVEITVDKHRILADVGGGVHCMGIGRSNMLGIASNIIGNFHQQNLWVEFDLTGRRVGFGKADCSRSV